MPAAVAQGMLGNFERLQDNHLREVLKQYAQGSRNCSYVLLRHQICKGIQQTVYLLCGVR